jgi:hypothetical protein
MPLSAIKRAIYGRKNSHMGNILKDFSPEAMTEAGKTNLFEVFQLEERRLIVIRQ